MSNQTIGIIGGMGPRVTVEFEKMILDVIPGADQNLPTIVSYNLGAIPDRSSYVLGYGENPAPYIQKIINQLSRLDVDVLVMPCNSAHTPPIFDQLDMKGAYFLHMPRLVADRIHASGSITSAVILATEGTVKSGMYQQLLTERGLLPIVVSQEIQRSVTNIIRDVKCGTFTGQSKDMDVLNSFITDENSNSVILGCTELSEIASHINPNVAVFDTTRILAEAAASLVTLGSEEKAYDPRQVYA